MLRVNERCHGHLGTQDFGTGSVHGRNGLETMCESSQRVCNLHQGEHTHGAEEIKPSLQLPRRHRKRPVPRHTKGEEHPFDHPKLHGKGKHALCYTIERHAALSKQLRSCAHLRRTCASGARVLSGDAWWWESTVPNRLQQNLPIAEDRFLQDATLQLDRAKRRQYAAAVTSKEPGAYHKRTFAGGPIGAQRLHVSAPRLAALRLAGVSSRRRCLHSGVTGQAS